MTSRIAVRKVISIGKKVIYDNFSIQTVAVPIENNIVRLANKFFNSQRRENHKFSSPRSDMVER